MSRDVAAVAGRAAGDEAMIRRRFEAVIFDWDCTGRADRAIGESELRSLIERLSALGMDVAVVSDSDVDTVDGRLEARPRGPGALHLLLNRGSEVFAVGEHGVELLDRQLVSPRGDDRAGVESGPTDKSHSVRWIVRDLWRRGIGARLVLLVGDEFGLLGVPPGVVPLSASPDGLRRLLADQLARRLAAELPDLDGDPGWTLAVEGVGPELKRGLGPLLTLADGRIGTRGSVFAEAEPANPVVLAAGCYLGREASTELIAGPLWNRLPAHASGRAVRRTLDLRTGVISEEFGSGQGGARAILFSSLARPRTAAMRAAAPGAILGGGNPLSAPQLADGAELTTGADADRCWMRVGDHAGGLTAAATETVVDGDGPPTIDRFASYRWMGSAELARQEALDAVEVAREAGFERLLLEHRAAWGERWEEADVEIEGDAELQRAVRLALFHLIASVADEGESAVGARGLSGRGYLGHVFWDSDVFVLPFLAATHPAAARAMLEYRVRRLPAALAAARKIGRSGARFAWESAASGDDVTPTAGRDPQGRTVEIYTGQLEEHIVADVAWAVSHYLDWTGDDVFAAGSGMQLVVETARYWASRIEIDADGRGHIRGVIGPDEYHVGVDDNAFTNVMARWNLRRAADLAREHGAGLSDEELRGWLRTAEALVDGFDPDTRVYEEFAGFNALEPMVAADLRSDVDPAAAQVVKQADVLMLHHLVPDEAAPGSLAANLDYYAPRTAHTSSLSSGVHSSLLARAGRLDDAVDTLRRTARIDLDDSSHGPVAGVHLGAMGSVWQALAFGFLGIRASQGVLRLDPRLPESWDALGLRLRFRGARVRIRAEREEVQVSTDQPIRLAIGERGEPATIGVGTSRFPNPGR